MEEPRKRKVSPRGAVQKGKVFERTLVHHFRSLGLECGRGFAGSQAIDTSLGSPDLIGLPELAVEAKRNEALNLSEAMAQARRNAGPDDMAVVINRKSRQALPDANVHMSLRDFTRLYHGYLRYRGHKVGDNPADDPTLLAG